MVIKIIKKKKKKKKKMFKQPLSSLRLKLKLPKSKRLYAFVICFMLSMTGSVDNAKMLYFIMVCLLYLHLTNLRKSSRIQLFHNQNFQTKNVSLEKLTYLKDAHFHPTPYLSHPILQAMYNQKTTFYKPDHIHMAFHREYIRLPDCGQVSLDTSFIDHSSKKLLIIIHGLTGGSDMPYVRFLVQEAHKEGFNALVFHNRGINNTFLTTPEPFHGTKVDDFDFGMKYISEKYKGYDFYVVGFSFGANQLMRFLGTSEQQKLFKAAVAISLPFDLPKTVENIDKTIFAKNFVNSYIKNIIKPNIEILKKSPKKINFEEVFAVKTAYMLHHTFSIKIFDYPSVDLYLKDASITPKMIDNIKIPVLILNSKDDFIAVKLEHHLDAILRNENILFAETERGGHVCWFTGNNPKRWYPKPTLEFLRAF